MTKESDMKPHGLSEEQLTHYREEGFVDVPGLFDREDLRAAEDAIEELTTRAVNDPANLAEVLELEPELVDGRRIPRRLYNPFLAHEGFRSIAGDLAEAGYVFSHWTGDAVGSENPLSLIIDSGKNVAANFIPEEAAEYLAVATAADLGLVPLADVTSDPDQFGLYTRDQLQGLAIGQPLIARDPVSGKMNLRLGFARSADLQSWFNLDVGLTEVTVEDGQVTICIEPQGNAEFYRVEFDRN